MLDFDAGLLMLDFDAGIWGRVRGRRPGVWRGCVTTGTVPDVTFSRVFVTMGTVPVVTVGPGRARQQKNAGMSHLTYWHFIISSDIFSVTSFFDARI